MDNSVIELYEIDLINSDNSKKKKSSIELHFRLGEFSLSEVFNGTACLKNVNNCWNTNIYSYLETSGGQSSNP